MFIASGDNERDNACSCKDRSEPDSGDKQGELTKIAPALVRKHCGHHPTTNSSRRKFRRDDRTQRIISTNSDTHLRREASTFIVDQRTAKYIR